MAIRKRNNNWQVDVCFKGERVRSSAKDKRQALQQEKYIKKALVKGKLGYEIINDIKADSFLQSSPEDNPIPNLEELFEYAYNKKWAGTKSEDTAIRNGHLILRILGKKRKANSLNPQDVDRIEDYCRRKGLSASTINRKKDTYSVLLNFAIDRGFIKQRFPLYKTKEYNGRIRFISREEENKLFEIIKSYGEIEALEFFTCLVDTGLRKGELYKLHPQCVQGNNILIWETKNDTYRKICMTSRVQEIINRRAKEVESFGVNLEENSIKWKKLIYRCLFYDLADARLRRVWNNAKRDMQLAHDKEFVPHCLRHTCCTRLIGSGMPINAVKAWMGHKAIETTMRYAHLFPNYLDEAVRVLENFQDPT